MQKISEFLREWRKLSRKKVKVDSKDIIPNLSTITPVGAEKHSWVFHDSYPNLFLPYFGEDILNRKLTIIRIVLMSYCDVEKLKKAFQLPDDYVASPGPIIGGYFLHEEFTYLANKQYKLVYIRIN